MIDFDNFFFEPFPSSSSIELPLITPRNLLLPTLRQETDIYQSRPIFRYSSRVRRLFSRKAREKYGKVFMMTVIKLISKGLLMIQKLEDVYKIFSHTYNYYKENKKENILVKFIESLPKEKYFYQNMMKKGFNDKKNYKNLLFCKYCIDIYTDYYTKEENFTSSSTVRKFYKLGRDFFEKMSAENLESINKEMEEMNLCFYALNDRLSMSKQDNIEYYTGKINNITNLIGGIEGNDRLFVQ